MGLVLRNGKLISIRTKNKNPPGRELILDMFPLRKGNFNAISPCSDLSPSLVLFGPMFDFYVELGKETENVSHLNLSKTSRKQAIYSQPPAT